MAFYGIPSAGLAITAGTGSDTLSLFNNATAVLSATTVKGLEGNDVISLAAQGYTATASGYYTSVGGDGSGASGSITLKLHGSGDYTTAAYTWSGTSFSGTLTVTGVLTSERAARSIQSSQLYGNQGNDTIALGDSFTTFAGSTLGGGAGNDFIGNYTNVNNQWTTAVAATAATISAAFVEGGGGNDTLEFNLSAATVTASTLQGGQGNDSIVVIASAGGAFSNTQILGGGGADDISADLSAATAVTVAGGGGNDSITLSAAANAGELSNSYIAGDAINNLGDYDGNDLISAFAADISSTTIAGMGGNDSIYLSATTDAGNNLIAGNTGNDLIDVGQTKMSGATLQGGAGNDTLDLVELYGAKIHGGGGNDHIDFTATDWGSGADFSSTTIYGGAGADLIGSGATISAAGTVAVTFGYSAYADSTLSAMDTIAVGQATTSATYVFTFDPAGLSAGKFSSESKVTATDGVATFTSTFDTDVTSRVAAIDAVAGTGAAVLFRDGSNDNYLFIQGGTDDLVVQIATAGTGANGTLTVNASKTITINNA